MTKNQEVPFKRPYRWVMMALILIVPFCTMVPYVAPAVFMGDIMQRFGVEMSLAGLTMTIQLGATGVCMFIGSFIQDKLGMRKSIILAIFSMTVGNLIASIAPSIAIFLVARLFSGFGQGLFTVSMTPTLSTWFTGKERTYVLTLNGVSNSLFLALSYSINRPLANAFGSWQKVFMLYAGIIGVIAVLWVLLSKDSPEAVTAAQQKTADHGVKKQSSLARAAKEVEYWKIAIFATVFAMANTSIASFLPTYLAMERGVDSTVATTISSLNSLFGIAGSLLGGFLCAQLPRRKPIMYAALAAYIVVGFGLTLFTSGGILVVLALAAGALYFIPITTQSTVMIEAHQPFDPAILGGAAPICSGISQLMCVLVSFIFSAIAAASNMTTAYRVLFALCVLGVISAISLKETGPAVRNPQQTK